MASSNKRKTTMAKLNRERGLAERRLAKQAKKAARKLAAASGDQPAAANGDQPEAVTGDQQDAAPADQPADEAVTEGDRAQSADDETPSAP